MCIRVAICVSPLLLSLNEFDMSSNFLGHRTKIGTWMGHYGHDLLKSSHLVTNCRRLGFAMYGSQGTCLYLFVGAFLLS